MFHFLNQTTPAQQQDDEESSLASPQTYIRPKPHGSFRAGFYSNKIDSKGGEFGEECGRNLFDTEGLDGVVDNGVSVDGIDTINNGINDSAIKGASFFESDSEADDGNDTSLDTSFSITTGKQRTPLKEISNNMNVTPNKRKNKIKGSVVMKGNGQISSPPLALHNTGATSNAHISSSTAKRMPTKAQIQPRTESLNDKITKLKEATLYVERCTTPSKQLYSTSGDDDNQRTPNQRKLPPQQRRTTGRRGMSRLLNNDNAQFSLVKIVTMILIICFGVYLRYNDIAKIKSKLAPKSTSSGSASGGGGGLIYGNSNNVVTDTDTDSSSSCDGLFSFFSDTTWSTSISNELYECYVNGNDYNPNEVIDHYTSVTFSEYNNVINDLVNVKNDVGVIQKVFQYIFFINAYDYEYNANNEYTKKRIKTVSKDNTFTFALESYKITRKLPSHNNHIKQPSSSFKNKVKNIFALSEGGFERTLKERQAGRRSYSYSSVRIDMSLDSVIMKLKSNGNGGGNEGFLFVSSVVSNMNTNNDNDIDIDDEAGSISEVLFHCDSNVSENENENKCNSKTRRILLKLHSNSNNKSSIDHDEDEVVTVIEFMTDDTTTSSGGGGRNDLMFNLAIKKVIERLSM